MRPPPPLPPSYAQQLIQNAILLNLHTEDWVRLHAGLAPPHWRAGTGATWDAGYEATGFFLDWLEDRYGYGVVSELNGLMRVRPWDEGIFKELTGRKIAKLWKLYREYVDGRTVDAFRRVSLS